MKGLRDNKRVRNAASGLLFLLSGVMFFLDWWSASFTVFKERITPLESGELSDQMNNVASWLGNSAGSSLRPWIIGLLVIHRAPLNVIVVGSSETSHHYCLMCGYPPSALTVTFLSVDIRFTRPRPEPWPRRWPSPVPQRGSPRSGRS